MLKTKFTDYQTVILMALQRKPMYLGTVDSEVIQKRRAKNKAARKARKLNRKIA